MDHNLAERYSRQILFAEIGEEGQKHLLASSAVLIGCGATGTVIAGLLARAGAGRLRVVDRDFVEFSNLQRQTLFDEADARESLPKAVAAERKLRTANSSIAVEGIVADVNPGNCAELLSGFDLILDGTDNFETRFLLNDFAVKHQVPWIYSAAVASVGLSLAIRPGVTACLACLIEGGAVGMEETCDTAGVLGAVAHLAGSLAAGEALKVLAGRADAMHGRLVRCDLWSGRFQQIGVERNPGCRACARREFPYLEGEAQPQITFCGRNSVQIHECGRSLDLGLLRERIAPLVEDVRSNDFLLRFRVPPYQMTVFRDGRALIQGTQDSALARTLYARYIGA